MLITFLLISLISALNIELVSVLSDKYVTKQSIGGQQFLLQIAFDTNLLMVVDVSVSQKGASYSPSDSKSFQVISPSSELCWSLVQASSTSECAFMYTSESNYTAEGALSIDTVLFGSSTLKEFTFGRILRQSSELQTSGILGLGPANLDYLYGTSLSETVFSQLGIHSVIAMCMDGEKGTLHLGGYDSSYNSDDFSVYPMMYNNRYSVKLSSVTFNEISIGHDIEARINPAIHFIYLPYDNIIAMIAQMKTFYGDACQQALCEIEGHLFFGNAIIRPPSALPDLFIDIQGFSVSLKGFLRKCNVDQYCSIIRCGGQISVLGSPILEKLYLVIDMENSKIAMAPLASCRSSESLILLNSWEQSVPIVFIKLFMMIGSLVMIIIIGWRCGKSYELEFEIIAGDDD